MATTDRDDVPWLTEDEQMTWVSLLSIMFRTNGPLEAQLQRDSNMSLYTYLVLSRLSMAPDRRVRMSDLAILANSSPSRLSNVARQLEAKGWITRTTDPDDRRSIIAEITDAGMATVEQAAPGHVRAVREHVIDPLTAAQQKTIKDIAERLHGKRLGEGPDAC